ncbi:MAG: cache domain-containing protein [Desulfobacterales bacterium]
MIINCQECGKKYSLDPAIIQGAEARFACKVCDHIIEVAKPAAMDTPAIDAGDTLSSEAGLQPTPQTDRQAAAKSVAAASLASGSQRGGGMGLTGKVIIQMLAVSLLPLLVFWGLTFQRTSQRVDQDFRILAEEITGGLTTQVDEWIDKNVRALNAFARLPAMVTMDRAQQEILLETISQEYPWVYLAFTTDTRGMNIARSDGKPLTDYSDRSYYKEAIARKGLAWQNLIGRTSKKPALVMATPIKNGEIVVGVLAIAMQIDAISKRIATWNKGETGHAFLVDESGRVVAHQLEAFVQEQKDLGAHPLIQGFKNGAEGLQAFTDESGKAQIGQAKATQYGWTVAIQQAEAEAYNVLRQERRSAIILLAATVLLVILFALYVGRRIVTPIRELTTAADRISVGELDVEIDIRSKDEIAALGDAIARMQDSIRLSIERLRRRR